MAFPVPPAHLLGSPTSYEFKRGASRRLHNRRINLVVLRTGEYQLHIAKALARGEAAQLRREGHLDTVKDYILRDRVRYSLVTLSAEAFRAVVSCWRELEERQQRKRA